MNGRRQAVAHRRHRVREIAAVDLRRLLGGIGGIELGRPREDEVFDLLGAAFLFRQIAILAFAAKEQSPLQYVSRSARHVGNVEGAFAVRLEESLLPSVANTGIGIVLGGVVEMERAALL